MSVAFVKTQIRAYIYNIFFNILIYLYIYRNGISTRNMLAQKLENSEHADGV